MEYHNIAKPFLISFILLFTSFSGVSAEFKVKSFEKEDNDLAARRFERQDINGETCALIKISTDLQGLKFQSGFGIVGDVLYKKGQYWVYLSPGELRLSIYKTGFIRLNYDIPLPVHSSDVFHMVLSSKGQDINKLPVTFMVEPADATITIDGKTVENEQPVELSVGEHRLVANRENYQTLTEDISVDKQNVLFKYELKEIEDAGVQITSDPIGAKVILDGVELGTTPVSTFYPAGRYPIKLTKEGYVTIEDKYLQVTAPTTTKNYTLEENVGYLTVNTRPEATVRFNGKEVEGNTRIKLNPSVVNVKVTMPKAETLDESVVIKRNDDKTIELMPDIQTGTIQVAPTPFDAKVELTGDAGEHYTAGGMKVFSDIPEGTYQLEVSREGFQTYESEITLRANDKVTRNPKLKKGPDIKKIASMEMVKVEGGCFDMGCTSEQSNCDDNEKPVHEVCVDDFYMSKTEVTVSQFKEFIQETGYKTDAEKKGYSYIWTGSKWEKKNGVTWKDDVNGIRRSQNEYNHPVIHVSWNDANAFAKWAGGSLPTEVEWEYAARGGNKSRGYKYAGSNDIDRVAWNSGNSNSKTHPVGTKQPNELGLYDMSGNVWEWCSDWYDKDYYGDSRRDNPQGPPSGSNRVGRGGSWSGDARSCRVASRGNLSPDFSTHVLGFRLSRSVD